MLLLGGNDHEGRRDRDTAGIAEPERRRSDPGGLEEAPEPEASELGAWLVTGRVTDSGGAVIAGATVRATLARKQLQEETRADEYGEYGLRLPHTAVTFDVFAVGFLPLVGLVNGRSNGTMDFVGEGGGPWTRDFKLVPAATLTGSVRAASGVPVKGAAVYVLSPEHQILDRETVGNVVTTNERGEFAFPGLLAGVYDLGARARGFLPHLVRDVAELQIGLAANRFED